LIVQQLRKLSVDWPAEMETARQGQVPVRGNPNMHVKLKILRGASAGKVVTVRGPRFYIGRSEECNLRANSDAISRRHCEITVNEADASIRDLGSRNGTYVNGERIEGQHNLQMGDQLRVGPLEFLVTFVQPAKTAAPAQASVPTTPTGVATDEQMADMVSDWLEEADQAARTKPMADQETREFRLTDTQKAKAEPSKNGADTDRSPAGKGAQGQPPAGPRPGKMKSRGKDAPKDTQEAAAQMLRKFFNRG
jgi:pSer/pThr/pTyr-binding forkhead associated (FHA) protein